MKKLNPFTGTGAPIAKLHKNGDARYKLLMASAVAATLILFSGLFIQGCQRQPATSAANEDLPSSTTPSDANGTASADKPATTNTVAAAPEAASTNVTTTASTAPTAPATPEMSPTAPAGPTKDYTVVKGDSFYKIAKAHHITMKALTDANPGMESSKLKIGQTLHIPEAAETAAATPAASGSTTAAPPAAPAAGAATAMNDSGAATYVVKSGDTLGRIAKAHGTTVKAIKSANNLTSDRIAVGKSLKLPPGKTAAATAA